MIPDVNHYHPIYDWGIAKKQYPFLISKATQGTKNVDPTLNYFVKMCEKLGIPYWLYTFLNKGGELQQAVHMVDTCKPIVGVYFQGYILDVESGNSVSDVSEALNYIKTQSGKTMIYTGYKDYKLYSTLIASRNSNCAWWESRYGINNGKYSPLYPCHKGADLYQYSSRGQAPGVSGACDVNMLTGTLPESWFTGKTTPVINDKPIKYVIGNVYTTAGNMIVRTEPHGAAKPYSQLSVNAKVHAMKGSAGEGVLKLGTKVTVKEVKESAGTWIRIPSGWICAVGKDGKVYIK